MDEELDTTTDDEATDDGEYEAADDEATDDGEYEAADDDDDDTGAFDWEGQVSQWGGEERISDALAIADALGHDDGIKALVREGLVALGLDPDAAFSLARGEEQLDPDDVLTRAEVQDMLSRQTQTANERSYQQQVDVASRAVDEALASVGANEDEDMRAMVLTFAQRHVSDPDTVDSHELQEAIKMGYYDYTRVLERAGVDHVEKRHAANSGVPRPLKGGGAPAETPASGPKSLDEAKIAARKFLSNEGQA